MDGFPKTPWCDLPQMYEATCRGHKFCNPRKSSFYAHSNPRQTIRTCIGNVAIQRQRRDLPMQVKRRACLEKCSPNVLRRLFRGWALFTLRQTWNSREPPSCQLFRRNTRLRNLLCLSKRVREELFEKFCRSRDRDRYHVLRKAEAKAQKLRRDNRKNSEKHRKGVNAKKQRIGCGKQGSRLAMFNFCTSDLDVGENGIADDVDEVCVKSGEESEQDVTKSRGSHCPGEMNASATSRSCSRSSGFDCSRAPEEAQCLDALAELRELQNEQSQFARESMLQSRLEVKLLEKEQLFWDDMLDEEIHRADGAVHAMNEAKRDMADVIERVQHEKVAACQKIAATELKLKRMEEHKKKTAALQIELELTRSQAEEQKKKTAALQIDLELTRSQAQHHKRKLKHRVHKKLALYQSTISKRLAQTQQFYVQGVFVAWKVTVCSERRVARAMHDVQQHRAASDVHQQELLSAQQELAGAKVELQQAKSELQSVLAQRPINAPPQQFTQCSTYRNAERVLCQLDIHQGVVNRAHDRCYCIECYPVSFPNTIRNEGPKEYIVPRGWVRIGLLASAHADIQKVWTEWCVSFHGLKHELAKSILENGGALLMPGDKLPDGSYLRSTKCAGRQDNCIYTSPTVRYAGLRFYAEPFPLRGTRLMAQVVLQCRQKPNTFQCQSETMGFRSEWDMHDLCPHAKTSEIEWITTCRQTLIPYGLLIRTYEASSLPAEGFKSPRD